MHRERTNRKLWLALGLAALLVAGVSLIPAVASAEEDMAGNDHAAHETAALNADLAQVRRATARFHDLEAALAAGYELGWVNGAGVRIITGCISNPTAGAMGYHYFHPELMADLTTDALEPEALVYESGPNGKRELVAVEWVVRGELSNPPGVSSPPSVLGLTMHVLNPAVGFYLRHAWVWKPNPAGMLADWNPEVTCP
jgi:hypothetical protein